MNLQPESVDASSRMNGSGSTSLRKIAVIGRGTAGSLAAASVTNQLKDSDCELHHIHDPSIPISGVGEGSWPSPVDELQKLTDLPHFTNYSTPQQVSLAYHLSVDVMADLLQEGTRARHIDARVLGITRVDGGAQAIFEGMAPEHYDLFFDTRELPGNLYPIENLL